MVHTRSSISDFHLCKWPTFIVTLAIKLKKKATLNRDTESINPKSLILLYDLFSFWGSEIHLIFMHSAYGGGPAEFCLWSPGVCTWRGNCWQHKHTTSCSATWRPPALSRLQHRRCLSLDGESLYELVSRLLFELYEFFSFVTILKRKLVAWD